MNLTPEEYQGVQDQIVLVAQFAACLPIEDLLADLSHAETVGPILDPTLYRKALYSGKLDAVRRLAEKALALKQEFERQLEEERKRDDSLARL